MKIHSFYIEDAEKHGVEKAVILYNLRFWLEKNKANEKNLHDGYYWTYNSAKAFAALFPYYNASKIHRLLTQLENDGLVLSGNYNKAGYDRTKWYSMPEFSAVSPENSHFSLLQNAIFHFCKMEFSLLQNAFSRSEAPIPDINTDSKPDSKPDSNGDGAEKTNAANVEQVKNVNAEFIANWQPPSREVMQDKLIMAGTPMDMTDGQYQLYVDDFKAHFEERARDGHPLKSDGRCQAKLRDWLQRERVKHKPQQTNYQGHNNANNQPANSQPRPSHYDDLRAQIAAKYGTSEQPRDIRTVSETT